MWLACLRSVSCTGHVSPPQGPQSAALRTNALYAVNLPLMSVRAHSMSLCCRNAARPRRCISATRLGMASPKVRGDPSTVIVLP